MSRQELAQEIFAFLEKYAKDSADYDPKVDLLEERFNGPDSAMFYTAALQLDVDLKPNKVWSEWSSGCYKMHLDSEGFEQHQKLLKLVNEA